MRWLAIALLAGCLNQARSTPVTERTLSQPIVERATAVTLRTEVVDGIAVVDATWAHRCHREVLDTTVSTTTRSIYIAGTRDGALWGYALAPLWVIFWPIGLGSLGVAYAQGTGTKVDRRSQVAAAVKRGCVEPAANLAVHLTLVSGRVVDGATDAQGTFAYLLPVTERGPVTARAEVPISAVPAAPIAAEPPVVDSVLPTDPTAANLVRTGRARARAGDCATVKRVAPEIRKRDAAYHDQVFVRDPAVAKCLGTNP